MEAHGIYSHGMHNAGAEPPASIDYSTSLPFFAIFFADGHGRLEDLSGGIDELLPWLQLCSIDRLIVEFLVIAVA